jgi:hypothetical protein
MMKVRRGFVSNSSSSSFIVAFDRIPQTVGEVQKALFGGSETYDYENWDGIDKYPAEQVAGQVWKDIQSQVPNDEDEIKDELGEEDMKTFLQDNGENVIFCFNYGDEDGSFFAALEHGGVFDNLPHRRISHH